MLAIDRQLLIGNCFFRTAFTERSAGEGDWEVVARELRSGPSRRHQVIHLPSLTRRLADGSTGPVTRGSVMKLALSGAW